MMLAGASITLSDHIKGLGMTTDSSLTFDQQIRNICKTSNFHILVFGNYEGLWTNRPQMQWPLLLLAPGWTMGNALLAGMSGSNLDKLQRVQNCLAIDITSNIVIKNCTGFHSGKDQRQDRNTCPQSQSHNKPSAITPCRPHQRV